MAARQHTSKMVLAGNFLVASPHAESLYQRSVVLLLAHDREGAHGILINQQLLQSLDRLETHLGELSQFSGRSGAVPVQLNVRVVRWAAGDLEREVEQGIWMRTPATFQRLQRESDALRLWVDLVRQIGRSVLRDALQIRDFPRDPSLN